MSNIEKPTQVKEIDLKELTKVCQEYIDFVDSEDYHSDNDYEYFISAAALESVFGEDVFEFINSKS